MKHDQFWAGLSQTKLNNLAVHAARLCGDLHDTGMSADVLKFMVAFDQLPRKITEQIPQADFDLASKLINEEIGEMVQGFNKLIYQGHNFFH